MACYLKCMTAEMSVTFSMVEENTIWKLQSDMEKYFHAFYHGLVGSAWLIMSIMFAFLRARLTITLASVFVMFSFKPL